MSFAPSNTFNGSIARFWNYTFYETNGTISNNSACYLYFDTYRPLIVPNGTVTNGTSCDSPINPIKGRAILGIVFAVLFVLMIPAVFFVLYKHGRRYMRETKSFRVTGRQWPWYWLLLCALLSMLAGFFAIDIDRDWVQGSALALFGAIYCCMLPTCLGAIWEMTRHWGSFQHRKMIDADPWSLPSKRAITHVETFFPIIFYIFGFLNFFLPVLRSWTDIQNMDVAAATDGRFKAGAIAGIIAWLCTWTIWVLSIREYNFDKFPWKIPAALFCVVIRLAYQTAAAWDYSVSPFRPPTNNALVYVLGFLPILGVFLVMIVSGFLEPNDDQEILRRRREKDAIDMRKVHHASSVSR